MNIVIRVDSAEEIGTGHLLRCLTLAEKLRQRECSVSFICRKLNGNVNKLILERKFTLYEIDSASTNSIPTWYKKYWKTDAEATINIIEKYAILIDLLIVDHYDLDYKWERLLKSFVNKIMVIDDLANRRHECQLLLDQNYKMDYKNKYDLLVPNKCKLLLGTNYLLIRDEFIKYKNSLKVRDGDINRILVFFGGTDPTRETLKTLHALMTFERNWEVDVIVGRTNPEKKRIKKLCCQVEQYNYYSQVNNISYFMKNADLAIGAGGATTWERCFMGLPSITFIVANNQKEVTRAVDNFGATINMGENVTEEMIVEKVETLIQYPNLVRKMSEQAIKLVKQEQIKNDLVIKEISSLIYS
ncbi:UDP-2,4-diacetamido-2,4,6-trideoxy-beta-L-altropyranose hydrolase [Virgibacillus halodenitrificans]|uniref:UDP-2,4-diacetamido-2,4, 6-trideoxy-beta-L-altropyranose hydrolase n=1 Tax=Virgibacillus halodenitrificans TaxID=1482 RepID=A0ABR7VH82_VIRHA|nr:UDP-2,4-diacetamido-2,4,6-trideoxy-beta-L-altropyranose hydrolase [Virgibacillus halodenitrificans]MBD1221294.1 UDP-2,4-diacetamido-2,4,6-trideoxy-beta-L-altropyranose hydrolase [Virgibacillus halodenitrificans]